ncbi:MSP domain protein [Teladorsagia circumcincta]|uniref:MSP domain protein n=1 Tax=Teladorsagia circumcincta TaxID=45464 RepID=A0A2G9TY88_TELCI|nr:MSP domain protein [Teladorsagia circumcincta]
MTTFPFTEDSPSVKLVKSSNNNDYRLKPVFGFVDPPGNAPLEITRTGGAPKEDKLVIQWAPAPADATDAQAAFPSVPADQIQSLTVPLFAR